MASLGNLYPNLPGMLIEFKDGGSALRFDDTDVNTNSLLLLGTAIDGPLMEPVAVDIASAELVFGSDANTNGTPNGSTLVHGFKQAYAAGCRDVRLMRISGAVATNKIETAGATTTNNERVDETDIAYIAGNDITTIPLPVKAGSTVSTDYRVYAKGKRVASTALTLDTSATPAKMKVAADTTDAGATIEVKYKQLEDVTKTITSEIVALDATHIGVVLTGAKSITDAFHDSAKTSAVAAADFSFTGGNLVIATGTTDTGLVVGNNITIDYVETVTTDLSVKQNAATSSQVVTLAKYPVSGTTPVLYIDGAKVLDSADYVCVGNTLMISKEQFKMNQKVSVSYFVTNTMTGVTSSIHLQSKFAGEVYNEGEVKVEDLKNSAGVKIGTKVTIIKPSSKLGAGEQPQVYTSIDYPTFGLLVDAINARNSVYTASTLDEDELVDNLLPYDSYFSNGDDGLNLTKDEMFTALSGVRDAKGYITQQGAYQLLENYQVDSVVPLGVYADDMLMDKYQNFAYELALFCAISSYKNKTTIGAISMKPLRDTSLAGIQKYAKYLAAYNNTYFMRDASGADIVDGNGDKFDLGKYISVVAGPTIKFNHEVPALREGNGAAMYLAYVSTLQAQSAPTNKKVIGTTGLKFSLSNSQLNDIVGNRMVTFQLKYSRTGQALEGAFCVDGPTAARPGSEYGRLSTVRVVRDVADAMREVADPYIGEANTIEQRNALSAAISKRLDLLVEKGVILNDYSFNLVSTAQDQVLGQASLELGIFAPQELRKITSVIGLKSAK
jgi:hypothetical protein